MEEAIYIVKTLNSKNHLAYFAGGWVRDYILNHPSDDIDIATDASPETVESLFPHTTPIGKAFGIILVIINNKEYEVATFREDIEYKDGRRPTQIKFTSAEIDAQRRDFTINGMFYDPINNEIIDYVNGRADIESKIIRFIGDPYERIKEDRLRMIRAIRLSSRFGFEIEPNSKNAIIDNAMNLFPSVAIERVTQEFTKMALYKGFKKSLLMLFEFNLLQTIFPALKNCKIDEIRDRLKLIDDFPHKTPIIISILELFPSSSLEEKIEICKYLKLSNKEIEFVSFFDLAIKYFKNENKISDYDWSIFYSNHNYELAIQIYVIHLPSVKRKKFLIDHEKKYENLKPCIDRIKNNDPVLKSDHLKMHHINPGIMMGKLLLEGEKISTNKKIFNPLEIIEELKKTNLWPK
ncbi:MAG: CCA tRNA nucleotidyltransferase [Parachlamydiales bacterium]|jgi:poly(A) polymerase